MLVQRFAVSFEYPVAFTRSVFDPENPVLVDVVTRLEPKRRHRLMVVVDSGVADAWPDLSDRIGAYVEAHADRLVLAGPVEIVPGGEPVKNQPYLVEGLQASLQRMGIDRHAHVLAIGGGAVLDMAGYVAGTAHRGVRMIRLPTTTLAQCDGGVGVKTGVNAFGNKNFLGTFTPPFAVVNDLDFIGTLSERDRRAGLAEAVKVGCIRDGAFFEWLEENGDALRTGESEAMRHAIERAAELHLEHIATSGDPFEFGTARPLDYGHWSAHKLEVLTEHDVRHGEAVAIGMALDARYAESCGLLDSLSAERLCSLLEQLGFTLWHPALKLEQPDGRLSILRGLEEFREHLGGELTLAMLDSIGKSVDVHAVDTRKMIAAIRWLEEREAMG